MPPARLARCLLVFLAFTGLASAQGNILVLVADDVGIDCLAAYGVGSDLPVTPTIDLLAQSGILFRNAWSNPLCSTTRATLQTGRYSFRTGVGTVSPTLDENSLPLDEFILPEMLDAGTGGVYAHALIGKWHLGGESVGGAFSPNLAGYGHFAGTLGNLLVPNTYYDWPRVEDGVELRSQNYVTTDNVDSALAWIQSAPEPWFCMVGFTAPHHPFHAPPAGLYTEDLSNAGDPDVDSRPYFKAMIEALDTEMGRLLNGIPNLSGTSVVFLGDNGTPPSIPVAPFEDVPSKGSLFEGGMHVPLIVSGLGVAQPGAECTALVESVDLFATVADLAGVDLGAVMPAGRALDSVSLLPYLVDPSLPSVRTISFAELFYPNQPIAGLDLPPTAQAPCFCQPDLGFATGTATLEICGDVLAGSTSSARLRLRGAPPSRPGLWYWSAFLDTTGADPILAGTAFDTIPVLTDPAGELDLALSQVTQLWAGGTLYMQMEVSLVPQPGIVASNVIAAVLPMNVKAVRDARYKLIHRPRDGFLTKSYGPGTENFYDLLADPFEQVNLLQGLLTPEEDLAYQNLILALETITSATPAESGAPYAGKPKNPPDGRVLAPPPCPRS